jgi:transcriptional regulator with XRE-family HTH domain
VLDEEIHVGGKRKGASKKKVGQHRYELRLLREAVSATQKAVAESSGLYQADISKLENKETLDDVQVSTLRKYAKALGGTVELVVVLNGRRYTLSG